MSSGWNKHPDADRLNVCKVDIGEDELLTIVCGAPNVAVGMRVPCALPGAVLPGVHHQEGQGPWNRILGMLCSAKELAIAGSLGLLVLPDDAPAGQAIRNYLDLDDGIFTQADAQPGRLPIDSGNRREVAAITAAP